MEWISALTISALLGMRHGFDPDHIAAITDMTGTNTKARRGLKLGILYALGHGLIVFCIGLIAIFFGQHLPEGVLTFTEGLVGASLLVLGFIMLRSLVTERKNFTFKSRWIMLYELLSRKGRKDGAPIHFGLIGAAVVGVIHGLGAETPTQMMVLGQSSQVGNTMLSLVLLLMFVVGLLMSTSAVSCFTAWGFFKARSFRVINVILGLLTGGYSLYLGAVILQSALS
ncbi:hypothetical protein CBW65_11175 [Tumebacillus avium]|uniref:Nickel/cobalt efflux system n=1 Tax=Tumebacillus avium TaxID=1903704 RepID=A0A1Y0IPW7_9BACL|nr:hypothetical protein [Tumebacillus avium]ARU61505.1 hypothetical protein CBW65_11175 [Tumebacillus avium]